MVAKVLASNDLYFGYNAETRIYEDLVMAGVIDPTKVTRNGTGERRFDCWSPAYH